MSDRFVPDLEGVRDFCDRFGLTYFVNEELGQLALPRPNREGWVVRLVPHPERGMFTIAYPLPGKVPPERSRDLALAVNLLNARTFLGCWVMNPELGELYFRHTVVSQGLVVDDDGFRDMLSMVIGTVEQAVPGLDAVLKGASPETVLAGAEA